MSIETKANFYPAKLLGKRKVASDVWEYRFEKPAGFDFASGQFVSFKINHGGEPLLRSYSIISGPRESFLEFGIKLLPDGRASNFFSSLKKGDVAEVSLPQGRFVCAEGPTVPKYFVATGVGLAPILPMLEERLPEERVELLFGARNKADLVWGGRLESLKKRLPRFKYRVTLSQPGFFWFGLKGRVTDHLKIDREGHYYLCGSADMVKEVRRILLDKGLNTKNVHLEIF